MDNRKQCSTYFSPELAAELKDFAERKGWSVAKTLERCFLEVYRREQAAIQLDLKSQQT